VLFMTNSDQDVCYCIYHENIELMLLGLCKLAIPDLSCSKDIMTLTVCDIENIKCRSRSCENCGTNKVEEYFKDISSELPVSYYQWNTIDKHVQKSQIVSTIGEATEELKRQLMPFATHVYNAKRQHAELRKIKETLLPNEVILQMDFAENYALKQQNEVMSAHWHTNQVTIYTAVAYYRETEKTELKHLSYAVISDDLNHDKGAVFANILEILKQLQAACSSPINKVHYWSDGAASQFKNKFALGNLLFHKVDFNCDADWSFFETTHGKGPVDGIGAEVKRSIWQSTLKGQAVVTNAEEFFEKAKKLTNKVNVIYLQSEKIEAVRGSLEERWSMLAKKSIQGTHGIHFVEALNSAILRTARNTPYLHDEEMSCHTMVDGSCANTDYVSNDVENARDDINIPAASVHIAVGDFVLVQFKMKRNINQYVALVSSIENDECEVLCLRKSDSTKRVI
jgi:hypothetical protein